MSQQGEEKTERRDPTVPRDAETLRAENRYQLDTEIGKSLEALDDVYRAAAKWMAIEEFIMQSEGMVTLAIVEHDAKDVAIRGEHESRDLAGDDVLHAFAGKRFVAEQFERQISVVDVKKGLAMFADDVMAAIAIENERRHCERMKTRVVRTPMAIEPKGPTPPDQLSPVGG